MTKNQISEKRENRSKKRQLKHRLMLQSLTSRNDIPIGRNIEIATSFLRYAVNETNREFRNDMIDDGRKELLQEILSCRNILL